MNWGRALTTEQKREVLERISEAWLTCPELRLGQLLANAIACFSKGDMFYVEDFTLAELTEKLAATREDGQ